MSANVVEARWQGVLLTAWKFRWYVAVALPLAIAAVLRVATVDSVPLPLSDEVFASVDVHSLVSSGEHLDGTRAGPLAYIVATLDGRLAAYAIDHARLVDLRLVAAAFGIATVGLVILLGKQLGDPRLGLIAAAALAIMPWHIYFSRIFCPASEYVFLTLLAIVLELQALRGRSLISAFGSALAAVATLYLYPVSI